MKKPNLLRIKTINANTTWCDKDTVLLHACFQLLTDFIELENPFETIDWEHTEEKKAVKKKLIFFTIGGKNFSSKKKMMTGIQCITMLNMMRKMRC